MIDGNDFQSQESFYERILEIFPETKTYFGYNLDALYDVLSEQSYESIIIKNYQKIRFELSDEFYMQLLEILFDLEVRQSIVFESGDFFQ